MNNFVNSFNSFLKNKNIVTIIGVVLIIGILYWGYNSQIARQVNPVRGIPVANQQISPGTLITDEMIDFVDISPVVLDHGEIAMSAAEVVGMYSDYNSAIPQGSMFYRSLLLEEDDLPDSVFTKVKDGDVVVRFAVTTETTYGNSILPGNKIDMYMKAVVPTTRHIMFGKFIENIEVIAVKDSSGADVFASSDGSSQPAMIIFGLDPVLHNLFEKARYLIEHQVELVPIPHGGTVEQLTGTKVTSQDLRAFIEAFTVPNPELTELDSDINIDDLFDSEDELDSIDDLLNEDD